MGFGNAINTRVGRSIRMVRALGPTLTYCIVNGSDGEQMNN